MFGLISSALAAALLLGSAAAFGECPEEDPLQHYTGSGAVVCPCFAAGEEGGAVFTAPALHYPIEILRVGIGWGSQYGGTGYTLEQSIHIYSAGLPNPGTPVFSLDGPQLLDGYVNEFDLEPLPGEIVIASGAFTVTLEFMNDNAGIPSAPSMIHDGNGCQAGKNVVYAVPGIWYDACILGVTGDWVVYVIYREDECESGIPEEKVVANVPVVLLNPEPNPFSHETRIEYVVATPGNVSLTVYNVSGQEIAKLADGPAGPGYHSVTWGGRADDGSHAAAGVYFVKVSAGEYSSTQRLILTR